MKNCLQYTGCSLYETANMDGKHGDQDLSGERFQAITAKLNSRQCRITSGTFAFCT
jgi:hypothetical protein